MTQTRHQSIIHKMKNWKSGLHPREGGKKNFYSVKDSLMGMKNQATNWEKNLQTTYLIKLLSPIYKALSKLNTKTIQLENGPRGQGKFTEEDTEKAQKHMRRYSTSLAVRETRIKTTKK